MESLDHVFGIFFARYRRKFGEARVEFAWRRACSSVWWILAWPTFTLVTVIVVGVYALTRAGTQGEHKDFVIGSGIAAYFLISFLLERRFKKFLLSLPELPQAECHAEKNYVFWFGAILNAVACIVLISGYILHVVGVYFIQGF